MIFRTTTPDATLNLAMRFAHCLKPGTVVTLAGELGAGKTLFAQGVARGLDVKDHVVSPTFTIINEYQGIVPFYHMDVYRLDQHEEIYELGLEEYFFGNGITLVEWAEKIKDFLPSELIEVRLEKGWDNDLEEYRLIYISARGQAPEQMIREFEKNEHTSG